MAQDCFLTFGIRRQMIMMQPGKLSILPLESKQWVFALASDKNIGHDFNLPLSCSVYAYSICHQGSAPGATGIQNGKAYDVGWDNTPVWIIAIGSK